MNPTQDTATASDASIWHIEPMSMDRIEKALQDYGNTLEETVIELEALAALQAAQEYLRQRGIAWRRYQPKDPAAPDHDDE